MKIVYDMVSGEFIDDELFPKKTTESLNNDESHYATTLQLQLVESSTTDKTVNLPADLAYQAFISTD